MRRFSLLIALLLICRWLPLATERQPLPITLEEAIEKALKSNLDLQIAITNPEVYQALLDKNRAIFIPNFVIGYNRTNANTPTSSVLEGGELVTSNNQNLSLDLTQQLALGGTLQVSLDTRRYSTSSRFSSINPSLNSNVTFSLSQPLLKNFGTSITRKNIIVAMNNQQKSVQALKQSIIDLIYSVEEAYWNLVYATQSLEVKQKQLELARDLLRQNEIQVKIGVSAPMDILTAKAEVAARESELLQSQNLIQLYEENLSRILNVTDFSTQLVPTSKPSLEEVATDFDQFLLEALEKRPDIEQVRLELKSKNIEVRYSRNQLLPDLQLTASYYTSGLSGDRLIYDGDPLFGGTVVGVIKGSVWDSMKDVFSGLYRNYTIGLQLSIPLKNNSTRADLAQAKLALKQTMLQLKKTESTIYSDVKQVINDLEAGLKIVEATRISRELAEQKLTAEQKKLAVGLSTNYQVLNFLRDLANAQSSELKATIDYNLVLSRLGRVLGTTLEKRNIRFADFL